MPDRVTLVDTKRLAQLTGDRDPQGWPMMNVTGGWNVVGVDEGPTTEHDGKLFIFFGDVATSDNGGHHPLGWNFILPNSSQGATDATGQPDWRFCGQCNGLFFAPGGDTSSSSCPYGGEHVPRGWTFYLPNNMQGATDATGQRDWRFCGKCHGLFFSPGQDATGTVCPAGNQHQPEGWTFYLPSQEGGARTDSGQPDWHFCGICHGLFWQQPGIPNPGICPGVNPRNSDLVAWTDDTQVAEPLLVEHASEGWNFILPNSAQGATDATGQPDWRFCGKCNGLFFAPQGSATGSVCPLGGEHIPQGWTFYLPNNMQGATDATGQRDWRFCGKCHGLFFSPGQDATGTVCPAGNQHQPEGWTFYLPSQEGGARTDSGQPDWHFCGICHGLSWTGGGSPGTCPASKPGGFRLHPVLRDGQNFDPVHATPPVGITKSLERPGGPFSYEGRAYTFANVSAPVYSEQVRFGNPTFGNYLIGKDDPGQAGPFDTEFLFSPRIGACPTGPGGTAQSHQVLGLSFIVPHDNGAGPALQPGWLHCRNCEALFWSGGTAPAGGLCWATRQPHDGTGSASYELPVDGTGRQAQGSWKRCGNCAVAVWTGDTATPDLCPGGSGLHNPAGPELHVPYYTDISGPPPDDAHNQSGWRFCTRCHGLVYTYLEDRFAGAIPHLVSTSAVLGLPPTTAGSGLVILGFGWRATGGGDFRLAWLPLYPGTPPRLQDTLYYTGGPPASWSPYAADAKDLWFHYAYTSIGLTWLGQLQRWLLLTTNATDADPAPDGDDPRARPVVARLAATPWDLAEAEEIPIFDPHADYPSQPRAYGTYMHFPGSDQIPQVDPPADDHQGWAYGAYPLERFITWDPATQELVLYYLLSLSRPYQVQVMKSTLRVEL